MGKTSELLSLLKTGNSDAARRLIVKFKKAGKKKALAKELNVPDDNGQTVIHFCAAQNFVEFLQDLSELGASIDLADNKGYTPLHLAAASGRTSAVTALVGMGADPNISSRTGDTALHLACHGGHATSVETLVAENANCTMLNVSGHTPLDLACQSGHAQVVSLLLRSGQFSASYLQRSDMPHTALMLAAKQGHNECIGLLIKHGFDVNRKLPGGNGGTALHEAALCGKVDTVRYLLQCGVDVQKTNAQGLTALDIVNMYTDPRTASIMKQVLQDALAQQARTRIAQQYTGQQSAPTASHHTSPSTHLQPAGFSYFSHPGQPTAQRQVSEHTHHHRQRHIPTQPPENAHQRSAHHQQPAHQQPGHQQPGHQQPGHQQPVHHQQPAHHQPVHQQPAHQQPVHHQQPAHPHHPAGHSNRSMVHSQQPHQYMGQSTGQSTGHSTGYSHQSSGQSRQPTGLPTQNAGQSRQFTNQSHSHTYHMNPPTGQQQHQLGHSSSGRLPGHQQQPMARTEGQTAHPGAAQPSPPQSVQHIYPKPGTPETVRKNPGIGGDLAAIIAAKAASRKPIVTSPTHKESVEVEDDRLTRSMTVGGEPVVQQARASAQQRRSSMSDRSSSSPERGDAPTLPRRVQAGPPSFKPVPPPADETRGQSSEVEGDVQQRRNESGDTGHRLQLRKPQPRDPPPTSAENELLAKLMRRQNKISEAESAALEPPPQAPEESVEEEVVQSKPPPPPQRKTPSLNTGQQPPQTAPLSQPTVPAPPEPTTSEPPVVRKLKPPTPKPKEVEPEMSPWQQELAARKARWADQEPETDPELVASNDDQVQNKAPSPTPTPKPAPKPKRKPPSSTIRPIEAAQEQPLSPARIQQYSPPPPPIPPPEQGLPPPPIPPPEQGLPPPPIPPPEQGLPPPPIPPPDQPLPPPPIPPPDQPLPPPLQEPSETRPIPQRREPTIVLEEAERPSLPVEVSTLVDQLSRSTSMSSLSAGAGLPQLSHAEHMPISEWLTNYKLADYAPVLEHNGYETTELMIGISHDELQEMGINKIGHRKKLISALSSWPHREHLFQAKPESVSLWLSTLNMSQYEETMVEAGYDDIDFICDITLDDLHDIGISKRGHVKRLLQGIGELTELIKSGPTFPSLASVSVGVGPPIASVPTAAAVEDPILPPPQNWTSGSPDKVDFGRMKDLLEVRMGVNPVPADNSEEHTTAGYPSSHLPVSSDIPPQLPPKKKYSPSHERLVKRAGRGSEELDRGSVQSFNVDDITSALDEKRGEETRHHGDDDGGIDQLNAVLQGLTADAGQVDSPTAREPEPDQLLADIDDMLADLTTHLDVMIPGST